MSVIRVDYGRSPALVGLIAGACCAGAMWCLPAVTIWPAVVASVGFVVTATAVALDMYLRSVQLAAAARHVERLCRLDYHELTGADLAHALPNLPASNPWATLGQRLQQSLSAISHRLQETEHLRAASSARVKHLLGERQQIAQVLHGLSAPVLAVDAYGRVILFNQAMADALQMKIDDGPPGQLSDLTGCEQLVELIEEIRGRRNSAQRSGDIELRDAQGQTRAYRATCRHLTGPSSEEGVVALLTDVSGQKAIQKRHAEFVAAVSHEMKTPLSGIKAYVELLADGQAESEETREQFLGVINGQADRLQRLIDNMLNMARIEADVISVNKQPLSLNELLEEAFRLMQPAAERNSVTLESQLSQLYLSTLADRDMLLQVTFNLLSNAIKYTPAGGRVILRSRMEDSHVLMEVEDTGVGLTSEDCRKVFEKFYRVKKDQAMASGTGLGLPLAQHIVQDVHGGQLTVVSEVGKGSTFRVLLPACGGRIA